jgi:hypothetical protein
MPRKPEEPYFHKVAERMVREGVSFRVAATEEGVNLTSIEAENIFRTKAFQKVLWEQRHKYAQEVANDPGATKVSAAGMMLIAIQKLLEEAQWDKAIAGIEKLAKLQGWMGIEGQVNVFAGLSEREYEQVKKKLEQRLELTGGSGVTGTA